MIEPRTREPFNFAYDWFSGNIPVLEKHLRPTMGKKALSCIEIGSFEGRSAAWFLENVVTDVTSSLHCIDTWASPLVAQIESRFDHNMSVARAGSGGMLIKHKGLSSDVLPMFPVDSADLIYVDGSHLARDVLTDVVLSWRLLRRGGIMICDDYELERGIEFHDGYQTFPTVSPLERPKMAIDAFMLCFEGQYRVCHKEWQVILEKL